jgi:hypothetical protein
MINPAFIGYPEEAALLGAMVIGYGELDLSFGHMAGLVLGQTYAVLDACHSVRSESARLDIAHALAAGAFNRANLVEEYTYSHAAMRYCLKVRNQHSHSQWADIKHGLHFTNAEGSFSQPLKPIAWKLITLDLLRKQEAYFEHTRMCLLTLITLLEARGKRSHVPLHMPQALPQPSMHSQTPTPVRDRTEPERKPQP